MANIVNLVDVESELKLCIAEVNKDIANQENIINTAKQCIEVLKKERVKYIKKLTDIQKKILPLKSFDELSKFFIEMENHVGSAEMYSMRSKFFEEFALIPNGWNTESLQTSFLISLDPDRSNLEKTKQDIMYFLPMLRVNKVGDITFGIDDTYSGSGYFILVFSEISQKWKIISQYDYSTNKDTGKEFSSLSGALEEIVQNYPNYQENYDDYDEED